MFACCVIIGQILGNFAGDQFTGAGKRLAHADRARDGERAGADRAADVQLSRRGGRQQDIRYQGIAFHLGLCVCNGHKAPDRAVAGDFQRQAVGFRLHHAAHHGGGGEQPAERRRDGRAGVVAAARCFHQHPGGSRIGADAPLGGDSLYNIITQGG